jgi:hypothetical protein
MGDEKAVSVSQALTVRPFTFLRSMPMLKHMKEHKHLKPGENGKLRLVEKFGDTLLCVRYRYDAIRDMRIKTAENIVDERPGKGAPRIYMPFAFLRYLYGFGL